jgi:hypothetical protein
MTVSSSMPAADQPAHCQSSIGRPRTGTRHLGISSVWLPRRRPRPAAIRMARLTGVVVMAMAPRGVVVGAGAGGT